MRAARHRLHLDAQRGGLRSPRPRAPRCCRFRASSRSRVRRSSKVIGGPALGVEGGSASRRGDLRRWCDRQRIQPGGTLLRRACSSKRVHVATRSFDVEARVVAVLDLHPVRAVASARHVAREVAIRGGRLARFAGGERRLGRLQCALPRERCVAPLGFGAPADLGSCTLGKRGCARDCRLFARCRRRGRVQVERSARRRARRQSEEQQETAQARDTQRDRSGAGGA